MSKKRVIITGASGFIGKCLIKKLLSDNIYVTAIATRNENFSDIDDENLKIIIADLCQYSKLEQLIDKDDYDIFFHLAWTGYEKSKNDYLIQIENIKATCEAVEAAAKLGCKRFVFTTSFSEYMIAKKNNIAHRDNGICNVYGATKESARILGQAVAFQKEISMISIALSNIFGPGDYSYRTPNLFISSLMNNKPINLTNGYDLYEWTYIDDAINGILAAAERGKDNKVYYLGANNIRPLRNIVEDIKSVINPKGVVNYDKFIDNFKCDYSSINIFDLYNDTGFQSCCDFKESILKTAQWLRSINFE